jgi:hypothetical protein
MLEGNRMNGGAGKELPALLKMGETCAEKEMAER